MGNVVKVVTKASNLIKITGLNKKKIRNILQDLEVEYGDFCIIVKYNAK